MINRHSASVAVTVVFLVLAAGSAKSKSDSKDTPTTATPNTTPGAPAAKAAAVPTVEETPAPAFVATVKENCEKYKAAPNDIKKSAVFTSNEALLKNSGVENARGKLVRLSTDQGGENLSLKVTMGDLEFTTERLFSPIKKGSAVYNQAAEMTQGQCVIFSAKGLKASSLAERSKVCDTEYFANFTSLKNCP